MTHKLFILAKISIVVWAKAMTKKETAEAARPEMIIRLSLPSQSTNDSKNGPENILFTGKGF